MSWLLRLWRTMPAQFKVFVLRGVRRNKRVYRWLLFRYFSAKDRATGLGVEMPPPELRYRVSGSVDATEFLRIGETCAHDIQSALMKVGRELASFNRVLDFGCGCGRTLVHLKNLAPAAKIYGTDVDAKAITWCRQRLGFATFTVNRESPPIDFSSDTFDFVYAISVFTHLNEDYQFRWLEELRRIAKPGALLLLTVDSSLVGKENFVFQHSYEHGLFPAWYQNAFHSRDYVFANFRTYFDVLAYLPRGMNAHQDVIVLKKRESYDEHVKPSTS